MERDLMSATEVEQKQAFIELGELAQGTIEAGLDQQGRLDELTERVLSGEFCEEITWSDALKGMTLMRCVDGRTPENGMNALGPNSAGGTESLFVADDLTTKRFAAEDGTTASGYANIVLYLKNAGFEIGGHTDSHAEGNASGCGANDKLEKIYTFIAENSEALRGVAAQLGVDISAETSTMIASNAQARSQFSAGAELLETLKENANEQFVDRLAGNHQEVLTLINTQTGTTLNRDKITTEFDENYQVFNVDVWAFEEAARATSISEEEVVQKVAALTYYNLATAFVLAGPKMRVVSV